MKGPQPLHGHANPYYLTMDITPRAPIANAPMSVILIADNCATESGEVVQAWRDHLGSMKRHFEILVVDGSGNESTAAELDALAARCGHVRVLHQAGQGGLGACLRTGLAAAGQPLVFYTLCNKQFQPADLPQLLKAIDKVDLVIGYRVWKPIPPWRLWLDNLYRGFMRVLLGMAPERLECWLGRTGLGRRCLARWLFGLRMPDPECPFALFRRTVFARLPIQSDGDLAPLEILAKANFLGCWMACAPVSWIPPSQVPKPSPCSGELWRLIAHPEFSRPGMETTKAVLMS